MLPNLSISAFMGLGDRGDFEAQGPLTGCSRLQAERRHTDVIQWITGDT